MDNKENSQVFDLEDILREFGAEPGQEPPEESGDRQVSEPEMTEPEMTDPEMTEPEMTEPEMTELQSEETAEAEPVPDESAPEEPFGQTMPELTLEDTIPVPQAPAGDPEEVQPPEEAPQADAEPSRGSDTPAEETPNSNPIVFRSKLSELKRKLVAGPEKRYYDLTEIGLIKVHTAIFLSFLVVVLCAGGTALYGMGMVLPNRLKLMVFSQVLALMVCTVLGCYVLMDGIRDLFTGKFSLNSMLFLSLGACAADAALCLQEQRVPCCAAFCLEMLFALWNRSLRRTTEMGQMDTLRKANRLEGLVKQKDYHGSLPGLVRTEGKLEHFMDNYDKRTGPEKTLNVFALLSVLCCIGIAVMTGLRHGYSLAIQVFATSMLVAVPAGAFVTHARPAAILQRRLHMVGTVICGWQGVKTLCGKASFPLTDRDLFPQGSVKLNGVKFLEGFEPEEIIAYAASVMNASGSGLDSVFAQLLKSRGGHLRTVTEPELMDQGIRGIVQGHNVILGTQELMQAAQVSIPEGASVSQAVYCAVDGQLAAVFAINYSRTKAAAAGLVTLGSYRKIRPLLLTRDFLVDPALIKSKFSVRTRRYDAPSRAEKEVLETIPVQEDLVAGALVTQLHLSAAAYAVSGAKALRTASRWGTGLHIFAGLVGMLVMAALGYLGDLELLSPFNVLMYQIVWLIPGLLVTEWTRTV